LRVVKMSRSGKITRARNPRMYRSRRRTKIVATTKAMTWTADRATSR